MIFGLKGLGLTVSVTKVSLETPTLLAGQCRLPLPTSLLTAYGREGNPVSFFSRVPDLPPEFLIDILVSSGVLGRSYFSF